MVRHAVVEGLGAHLPGLGDRTLQGGGGAGFFFIFFFLWWLREAVEPAMYRFWFHDEGYWSVLTSLIQYLSC